MDGFKDYTKEELLKKQEKLDQRKNPVTIEGLENPWDLAKVLHQVFNKRAASFSRGRVQCYSNRARTIEDAYTIAKTYIPGITYEQVYKAVIRLYHTYISPSFCMTVQKRVHNPCGLTVTSSEYRTHLGDANVRNPNFEKNRDAKRSNTLRGQAT